MEMEKQRVPPTNRQNLGQISDTEFNHIYDEVKNDLKCILFYSKTDLESAFRILQILPQHRFLLIMKARDPCSKELRYFLDKNLPFGSSVSCSKFQLFSDSLKHLVEVLTGRHFSCTNYLDDFLFVATNEEDCNMMVRQFLKICE